MGDRVETEDVGEEERVEVGEGWEEERECVEGVVEGKGGGWG